MSACGDFLLLDRDHAARVEAADVAAGDPGVDLGDPAVRHQLGFFQHALDRRHRRLDVDDHALLEAARRLRAEPDDVERRRRASTSATIATIFDVPMSRPTIRFFASFTIAIPFCFCASCASPSFSPAFAESRHAGRESVAIAKVDVIDACAGARERVDRAVVRRATKRASRAAGSSRPSSIASGPRAPLAREPPAAARGQPDAFAASSDERRERRARLRDSAPSTCGARSVRALELRQLAVVVGDEDLAAAR